MTPNQFIKLTDFLETSHAEIKDRYPNNMALVDEEFKISKPGSVSNKTHEEFMSIIDKWRHENNVD